MTSGEPGYGVSACEYFASRDIALQGGDSSANEAQPFGEEDGYAVPCHTQNQNRRGIWNIENLDLKPLADAKVHRVRVRLGAAADRRRHRLAGQSDRAVLSRSAHPSRRAAAQAAALLVSSRGAHAHRLLRHRIARGAEGLRNRPIRVGGSTPASTYVLDDRSDLQRDVDDIGYVALQESDRPPGASARRRSAATRDRSDSGR